MSTRCLSRYSAQHRLTGHRHCVHQGMFTDSYSFFLDHHRTHIFLNPTIAEAVELPRLNNNPAVIQPQSWDNSLLRISSTTAWPTIFVKLLSSKPLLNTTTVILTFPVPIADFALRVVHSVVKQCRPVFDPGRVLNLRLQKNSLDCPVQRSKMPRC